MDAEKGGHSLPVNFQCSLPPCKQPQVDLLWRGGIWFQCRVGDPPGTAVIRCADKFRQLSEIPAGNASFFPFLAHGFKFFVSYVAGEVPAQYGGISPGMQLPSVRSCDADAHFKMLGQGFRRPGRGRYIHCEAPVDEVPQDGYQRVPGSGHFTEDDLNGFCYRDQFFTVDLGQSLDQGFNFGCQQAGHQPFDSLGGDLRSQRRGYLERNAVVIGAGRKAIVALQAAAPQVKLLRVLLQFGFIRAVLQKIFIAHAQKMIPTLLFQQPGKRAQVCYFRQALPIKIRHLLLIDQKIPAPETVFLVQNIFDQTPVVLHEGKWLFDVTIYQGALNKNIRCFPGVYLSVRHFSGGDDNESEQRYLQRGDYLCAVSFPVRIQVGSTAQVAAQIFQPAAVNGGHSAGKDPGGFNYFRRNNPAAALVEKPGAGKDHHLSALGGAKDVLFFFLGDIRKQPA